MFLTYAIVLVAVVLLGAALADECLWWWREWRRQAHAGRRKGRIL